MLTLFLCDLRRRAHVRRTHSHLIMRDVISKNVLIYPFLHTVDVQFYFYIFIYPLGSTEEQVRERSRGTRPPQREIIMLAGAYVARSA